MNEIGTNKATRWRGLAKSEIIIYTILFAILLATSVMIFYKNKKLAPVLEPPVVEGMPVEELAAEQVSSNEVPSRGLLDLSWQYMQGMKKTDNGFVIQPLGISLVNQNGSFAQANPPINLFGTYLSDITGDFILTTELDLQSAKSASLQFYGQLPIPADEFRIERESIQLKIEDGKLAVNIWNGKSQRPSVTQSFPFDKNSSLSFKFTRQSNSFLFTINEVEIGKVTDPGIFAKKNLWFGFDAEGGEWLLKNITVEKVEEGTLTISDAATLKASGNSAYGLQVLAKAKRPDFLVGMAMAPGPMVSDPEYSAVALDKNIFGSTTPENEMKMVNLQPQKGVFSFKKADGFVHVATQNGLIVHGHPLVFGEANPEWFSKLPIKTAEDKKQIEQIMTSHITTVMFHYKDKISSWDVVNEPLSDEDGETFRTHKWYQAMGKDYIAKAFIAARKVNPNARLFINEYGLEEDGERWNDMVSLLSWLKGELAKNGVSTENIGLGFQSHVYERADKIHPEVLRRHIKQLESLGFTAQISEMDVYSTDEDRTQTDQYSGVFKVCFEEPNCKAWRGWILSDRYDVWKDDDGSINYGEDGLFGKNISPRPAYAKMQEVVK